MTTDLELDIRSNASVGIYKRISFDLTVTNTGSTAATDIVIDVPIVMGATLQGGNEYTATAGTATVWPNITWQLPSIAANSTETITLNYFTLTTDPVTVYAQVISMAGSDSDSTPNNGTPPKPNEDDEAAFTVGESTTDLPDLTLSNLSANFPSTLLVGQIYPYSFNLNNNTEILAVGDFRIGAYLSTDQSFSSNDILVGEIQTGNILANSTPVNGAIQVQGNFTTSNYYFILVVDDLQNIVESNDNNNTIVSTQIYSVQDDNTGNSCSGNFTATTQAELDLFPADCTTWQGSISINGITIDDLSPLANLRSVVQGSMTIENTDVVFANELSNLEVVEGTLIIQQNERLNRIDLSGLQQVDGLGFFSNKAMNRIFLPNELTVNSWLQFISNTTLGPISSFPNITNNDISNITIVNNNNFHIIGEPNFLSGAYPNLDLTISNNDNLLTLDGFENLTQVNRLTIENNPNLRECCFIYDLVNTVGYNTLNLSGNDTSCNSADYILDNCANFGVCEYDLLLLDVQCQNNNTPDDPSDDTYEATIEISIENSSCFGNYIVNNGDLGSGVFGAAYPYTNQYKTGLLPIANGDISLTFTDIDGGSAATITVEAPMTCSGGINTDECGFEVLQPNLPNAFSDAESFFNPLSDLNTYIEENTNGYSFINALDGFTSLETNFAGEETGIIVADISTFQQEIISNTEMEISLDLGGSAVWSNTFTFDSGDLQGDPFYTSRVRVEDGYVFLVKVFGVIPTGWILKTDFNGNQIYREVVYAGVGDNTYGFADIAVNGDFFVYRHNEFRQAELFRIDASNGSIIYQTQIVGDLVTSKMGGFRETLDGQFIYASYRDQLTNEIKKLDAFTGEVIWIVQPGNAFTQSGTFPSDFPTNVAVTQDGGVVISYQSFDDDGLKYARFSASGSLVWNYILPDNYNLEAQFPTSDGGFILTGKIGQEPVIVKITSEGLLTPDCGGDDGGGGNENADECGFEVFQPNLPILGSVEENENGYVFSNIHPSSSPINSLSTTLQTNFSGEQLSFNEVVINAFESQTINATQLEISQVAPNETVIWSNIFTFDSGISQSSLSLDATLEVEDGYVFLIHGFGDSPTSWVLKTDFDGNQIFDKTILSGFNHYGYFVKQALNGDFLIAIITSDRQAKLSRVDTNGDVVFNVDIIGGLTTSRVGGFRETLDGEFIYASYRDGLFNEIRKINAFTGETLWSTRPEDAFPAPIGIPSFHLETNVSVTLDGGVVISYQSLDPSNGNKYVRFNPNGGVIWARVLPGNYALKAEIPTSDGGFILAGEIDQERVIVKITSEGLFTPDCGGDDGGGTDTDGTDLELAWSSDASSAGVFSFVTATAIITNNGTEAATDVVVELPLPSGIVFKGGDEYEATQGNYIIFGDDKEWSVGNLAAGATASIEINYFVLGGTNAISLYGQVLSLNETDADSTPNNGTPPTVNEDDEAVLILPKSNNAVAGGGNNTFNQVNNDGNQGLGILEAFPNPASDNLTLNIGSAVADMAHFRVVNLQGQVLQTGTFDTVQGINPLKLNISDLGKGIHFVLVTQVDQQAVLKFVKE